MSETATPITLRVLMWWHFIVSSVVMGSAFLVEKYFVECLLIGVVLAMLGVMAQRQSVWSRAALAVLHVVLLAALSVGFLQFMNERSRFVGGPDGPSRGIAVDLQFTQLFVAALVIVPLSGFTLWKLQRPGKASEESGRTDNT